MLQEIQVGQVVFVLGPAGQGAALGDQLGLEFRRQDLAAADDDPLQGVRGGVNSRGSRRSTCLRGTIQKALMPSR